VSTQREAFSAEKDALIAEIQALHAFKDQLEREVHAAHSKEVAALGKARKYKEKYKCAKRDLRAL
jgi:outer membrane murein-binding lipoprotein Lpp